MTATAQELEKHRIEFENYVQTKYSSVALRNRSNVIDAQLANSLIKAIRDKKKGKAIDKSLDGRIKRRNFFTVLKENKFKLAHEKKGAMLQVALLEDFYETIKKFHNKSHIGINYTEAAIKERRACVPRDVIRQFVKTCPHCNLNQNQKTKPNLTPIESSDFWERCQLDLIDMRSEIHNEFAWIAHLMCHFTKYHVIWPMKHKSAVEVTEGLKTHVLPHYGLPKILQSDNGLEFKNALMNQLVNNWPGECKIIHGRARHPQTQGLIERGNQTLKKSLAKMKLERKTKDWPSLLQELMFALNTTVTRTIRMTPYHAVFNQQANIEGQITEATEEELNSGGQNAIDKESETKERVVSESETSESEANESEANESEANESEANESEANESDPREIEASESEKEVTMSDSQVYAELQGTIDTTANISTILSCYNCSKKIATSEPKSSRGWNSCEKCPNWCCAKCSRNFFDANQYFCTPCANKLDTTIPRTLIRTRQKVYVEKMQMFW